MFIILLVVLVILGVWAVCEWSGADTSAEGKSGGCGEAPAEGFERFIA